MIRLDEVAVKLEKILNGLDPETIGFELPTGFQFVVRTEGYHLDHIADINTGKNFIPVFISSMGGNFNPVPELLQANYVIPITFYFPVRFKNDAYKINEFLARVFVGRQWNYGPNSGTALSNISVAQYGEITDLDLKQFAEWVRTTYLQKVEIMEPFISMTISLYLSTASEDFVYGNEATATLTLEGSQLDPEPLVFVQATIQSNSEPASQQILGTPEIKGIPAGTSYGPGFTTYIKNDEFYKTLLRTWFGGNSQTMTFDLSMTFLGETYHRTCYIQAVNLALVKGELSTITFAFGTKAEIEDGGL